MMMKKFKNLFSGNKQDRVGKVFFLTRLLRSIGNFVDWIFKYNITLVVVAILSSSLLYIYVVGAPEQIDVKNYVTNTLEDVRVDIINEDNAKVIAIYDDQGVKLDPNNIYVDVILKGPRNEVLNLITSKDLHFFIDTSQLNDGETKEMIVLLDDKPSNVTISTSPSFFRVQANKKITSNDLVLQAEAVNKTQIASGLTIESVSLITNQVLVSGSEKDVNSVVTVKALVDVANIQTAGVVDVGEDRIVYKAYDNKGDVVDVEIAVKQKGATVVVSDYSREVPVYYKFIGETPEGKSIGEYDATVNTIRLYGEKKEIDIIESVVVDVNLADFSGDTSTVNILSPDGVISMSHRTSTVTIKYEDTASVVISDIPVNAEGLNSKYSVQSTSDGALLIDVTVSGAPSVINSITAEDIKLNVRLGEYGPGVYSIPVEVEGKDSRCNYILSEEFVELEIKE